MSKTETAGHTPGPWISDGRTVRSNAGSFVHDRSGARFVNRFALEIMVTTHESVSEDEIEATARLIGLAPQLLKACKMARSELLRACYNDEPHHVAAARKIGKLISKAEGRA